MDRHPAHNRDQACPRTHICRSRMNLTTSAAPLRMALLAEVRRASCRPWYRQEQKLVTRLGEVPMLSLPEDFLPVAHEWGQQVAYDAARAGFDLDRHPHARQEIDRLALDVHLHSIEADACG